jgi:PBP1b-binding outer membrane lipoprotein LpoB
MKKLILVVLVGLVFAGCSSKEVEVKDPCAGKGKISGFICKIKN